MKTNPEEYLRSLGVVAKDVHQRFQQVLEYAEGISPEPIENLFFSEYINRDGARVHESLWLFSQDHLIEARDWLSIDDLNFLPLRHNIRDLHWRSSHVDLKNGKSGTEARANLDFKAGDEVAGTLRASGVNCSQLWLLMKNSFRQNLTGSSK